MNETFFENHMIETFDVKVEMKPNGRLMVAGKLCIWVMEAEGLKALEVRDWSADAGPACKIPVVPVEEKIIDKEELL